MKKKLVIFCLYGDAPKYNGGLVQNVELAKEIYPDYGVRIYHDNTVPSETLAYCYKLGAQCIEMKDSYKDHRRMFWRFEVLKDDSVDRFLVRDADSRLNYREAFAVREWEKSDKVIHVIRDHPQHAVPIMGGLWGATNEVIMQFKDKYDELREDYFEKHCWYRFNHPRGPYFNTDQPFLSMYIWSMLINKSMAHVKKDVPSLLFTHNEKYLEYDNEDGSFCGMPYE